MQKSNVIIIFVISDNLNELFDNILKAIDAESCNRKRRKFSFNTSSGDQKPILYLCISKGEMGILLFLLKGSPTTLDWK